MTTLSPLQNGSFRARFARTWSNRKVVVRETNHALLLDEGELKGALDPGVYRIGRFEAVLSYPKADQVIVAPGQESLSADGAGVRATVASVVAITDPTLVFQQENWRESWYLSVQLAVRAAIAARTVEALMAERAAIDAELHDALDPLAPPLGLTLRQVAIRDLVVPGEMRRALSEVVTARLAGQAALERARAETAALRNLANAGRAVADNPALLQLRLLQQMEGSSGHTFVLGGPQLMPDGGPSGDHS
ncbi:MAG: SPFH domain-containing protein [Actinomycetota bacterium]